MISLINDYFVIFSIFEPFPIPGVFLIAPFLADVDTRGTGEVYFKESRDETLLSKANDIIQSSTSQSRGLSRYKPTWILIATWFKVGYFVSHTDKVVMCILLKYINVHVVLLHLRLYIICTYVCASYGIFMKYNISLLLWNHG